MKDLPIILALMTVMVLLIALARKVKIPYPMFLVIAGIGMGFIPGVPHIEIEPELVFLIFLPPILASAAFFTPMRDFKKNLRSILLLAVGLVFFSTLTVGWVLHQLIPSLPWAVCFTLGAIVAPPDAIAATAVAERLGLPHRVVVILEGESLVNDASALVAYKMAVAAALTGVFSLSNAVGQFFLASAGGIAIGLALGWLIVWIVPRVKDPGVAIVLTFLNAIGSYVIAEKLHVSGVLATVFTSLYFGQKSSQAMSPQTRVEGAAAWQIVVFLINGLAFMLIGLQFPEIVRALNRPPAELALLSIAVIGAMIFSRILWLFPAAYLPRFVSKKIRARDPYPPVTNVFLVGWSGMRGIVSLAAALALPENFPERDLLVFLTVMGVLGTLLGQGLSLLYLVPRLPKHEDHSHRKEEAVARVKATMAGLRKLEDLSQQDWVEPAHVEVFRKRYDQIHLQYEHRMKGSEHPDAEKFTSTLQRMRDELIEAETAALVKLRDDGVINDQTLWQVQRELDLERLVRALRT